MQYETLISLGYNCQTRFTFDQFTKLGPEMVLDGLVSHKLPKIIDLLKNEFNLFFQKDQLEIVDANGPFYTVKDNFNEITSFHDFRIELPFDEAYEEVIKTKTNQYQLMLNIIKNNPGNLLFVRRNKAYETLESIIDLRDTISSIRKEKPFELYVFQNKEWMNKKLGISNLFTFYDGNWIFDDKLGWVGNNQLWQTVFKNVQFNGSFRTRT
jgi:hypothetical protein